MTARQNDQMSTWNCRVVQSANGTEYFVAEVHYDAGERLSRVDDSRDCLRWDKRVPSANAAGLAR